MKRTLAGIGTFFLVVFVLVMFITRGLTDTAEEFLTAVKSDNYDAAYLLLSEDFKRNTSRSELKSYLESNVLNTYKKASWNSRSVSGVRGEIVGKVTNESGSVVRVSFGFLKTENGWRIFSIRKLSQNEKLRAGVEIPTAFSELPSERVQIKLVADTMNVFGLSVNDRSMQKFYDHISYTWQRQITVEQLDGKFKNLYSSVINLLVLDQIGPQFSTPASIDSDGILSLKGWYELGSSSFEFEHRYVFEGLGWKLLGFSVDSTQKKSAEDYLGI